MNPRTAILLVQKIHEMNSDVDEIKDPFFLVNVLKKLVEEKAL